MTSKLITIQEKVDDDLIDNIMSCALEGGINYWSSQNVKVSIPFAEWPDGANYASDLLKHNISIQVYEDDNVWQTLTLDNLIFGIEFYCKESNINLTTLEDQMDANIADQIVQYAIFGCLVYG
jgi:hypothetical protein